MTGGYKVITLCGSTRFKEAFLETQKRLTLEGNIVISVGLFGHAGDNEVWENMDEGTLTKTKEMLDDMHKRKIDMADEIYVINVGGYIGESTRSEIEYAGKTGKVVRYLEKPDDIKEKIIQLINNKPGLKASEIAKELGLERREINQLFYSGLESKCIHDEQYRWYTKEQYYDLRARDAIESDNSSQASDIVTDQIVVLASRENNELCIRLLEGQTLFTGDYTKHRCTGMPEYLMFKAYLFNKKHKRNGKKDVGVPQLIMCKTCGQMFIPDRSRSVIEAENVNARVFYDIRHIDEKTGRIYRLQSRKNDQITIKDIRSLSANKQEQEADIDIEPKDFLVRTGIQGCSKKNHRISDISASLKIMNKNAGIKTVRIPAIYCDTCRRYYILEHDYRKLIKQGVPICKIITVETLEGIQSGRIQLNDESLLHSLGYNVNAQEGLSHLQRQKLLGIIINEKIMTKAEVLSHLDYLIRRSAGTPRLDNARTKWETDRQFVARLKADKSEETVAVGNIRKREFVKK